MTSKSPIFSQHSRPLAFGHRGVPEEHQENTMAGFKRAIDLGLDGVELDVFLTKDKQLVVFHDIETERLTGFNGRIPDMNWDEIKDLEIASSINVGDKVIDYGKKEKIILLEDALEEMKGKLIVDIEIKAYGIDFGQRHTGTELAKLIKRMDLFKDVFVTSFNFFPLRWLEWTCPGIESGFTYSPQSVKKSGFLHNVMESSFIGKLMGSTLTNMSVNMFDDDTVQQVHEKGLAIGAWTLFSQDSKWLGVWLSDEQQIEYIERFTKQGIDYFITDDPARLKSILEQ
ncbi:MAG: glycerophosphodiester phosphodiesterase [Pseudomonadales bacterium]